MQEIEASKGLIKIEVERILVEVQPIQKEGIKFYTPIPKSLSKEMKKSGIKEAFAVDPLLQNQVLAVSQSLAIDSSLIEKEWIVPATVFSYDAGVDSRMRIDKDYN